MALTALCRSLSDLFLTVLLSRSKMPSVNSFSDAFNISPSSSRQQKKAHLS